MQTQISREVTYVSDRTEWRLLSYRRSYYLWCRLRCLSGVVWKCVEWSTVRGIWSTPHHSIRTVTTQYIRIHTTKHFIPDVSNTQRLDSNPKSFATRLVLKYIFITAILKTNASIISLRGEGMDGSDLKSSLLEKNPLKNIEHN